MTGHLVLTLNPDEGLQIGEAVIRCTVRRDGKITVYVVAPTSVAIVRESARKVTV